MNSQLMDVLPVAVYTTDPEGNITYYNEAAATLWGHRPELGSDRWCGSWRLWWPNGEPLRHEDCPMAVMLKEHRALPGVEAVAERPDGTRVPFAPYPKLLRDADGNITGAVNVLVEIGDRQDAHVDAERLAAIVASSDDAIVSKDLNSVIKTWNGGAERIFGYTADEMIGQSILRIIPERLHYEEGEIIAKLKKGERIDHFDTVRVTKDGRELELSITVSPIRDLSGNIIGASKVARDITQRKRDEAFQQLLIQELNHRVKNSLAIIQALASQSLRMAKSPQHFTESFNGRVQALAKAHDLLVRQRIAGSALQDLVHEQVHLGQNDDRIHMSGPAVVISGRDAIHLALVLHELATNARKHGALSPQHADGRLDISWKVSIHPDARVELTWRETGVNGLASTNHQGFGSRLIERSLEGLGGKTEIVLESDGLRCELKLPLEREDARHIDQPAEAKQPATKRILIVEDEPLIAMELEELMVSTGFTVVGPVGTIGGALRCIEGQPIDVALLDANLGGLGVDEVAVALTKRNIPFAFATGHDRAGLPRSFAAAPAIGKPFNHADVVATVSDILQAQSLAIRAR